MLGVDNGQRKNGFATILFMNADEAAAAVKELDGKYIGDRFIKMEQIEYQ